MRAPGDRRRGDSWQTNPAALDSESLPGRCLEGREERRGQPGGKTHFPRRAALAACWRCVCVRCQRRDRGVPHYFGVKLPPPLQAIKKRTEKRVCRSVFLDSRSQKTVHTLQTNPAWPSCHHIAHPRLTTGSLTFSVVGSSLLSRRRPFMFIPSQGNLRTFTKKFAKIKKIN